MYFRLNTYFFNGLGVNLNLLFVNYWTVYWTNVHRKTNKVTLLMALWAVLCKKSAISNWKFCQNTKIGSATLFGPHKSTLRWVRFLFMEGMCANNTCGKPAYYLLMDKFWELHMPEYFSAILVLLKLWWNV